MHHLCIGSFQNGLIDSFSTSARLMPMSFRCFVAQARQQFALAMQLIPATDLMQQIGYQVNRVMFCALEIMLTFHLVALRFRWLQSRARSKINPTNVSDGNHISEIDVCRATRAIDTEVLRTFVAIADQGGFTRAGELVNRTQSAVSMQMKRLEEDVLQRQLFQRDGRQVRLTAEGQVLLGYARRILKLHSEVFNTLREPDMIGTVRIGTPDDYVMRFLPGILRPVCAVLSADPDRSALRIIKTIADAPGPGPVHCHP
jgi:DNA-binding transcriptional ArsR family regulator